ncbi:MAG: hypothetical protein M5U26_08495 [Planctomycetota bacterium]|nr:hypothetical protein [Planctomycetota bacterium]
MRPTLDRAKLLALAGQHDEAEALLRELPPSNRRDFNLGWHLCRRGHWRAGLDLMAAGRAEGVFGSPPLKGRRLWEYEDLRGKTVLLHGEGGLGDQLCNVRWARDLADLGARVIATGHGSLLPILAAAPGVSLAHALGNPAPLDFDYWLPAMNGPSYFEVRGEPYLSSGFRVPSSEARFRVGLRWAGLPEFEHDQLRRFPTEPFFEELFKFRKLVDFVSLQRDVATEETPEGLPAADTSTWEATAHEIAGLDLVISSCTSVAHLAAGLGVPTWILVPRCPYYPWAVPGERSAWYSSVRLFRQRLDGSWPFEELRKALSEVLERGHPRQPTELERLRGINAGLEDLLKKQEERLGIVT